MRWEEGRWAEDFKLTPLWILPNPVSYSTLVFKCMCTDISLHSGTEKSKGGHGFFLVICFVRKKLLQSVRRQDGQDRNKEGGGSNAQVFVSE